MCSEPHPFSEETALVAVRSIESREIEGVTVEIEVTRHRCATHGDGRDPHRVIRREPGL